MDRQTLELYIASDVHTSPESYDFYWPKSVQCQPRPHMRIIVTTAFELYRALSCHFVDVGWRGVSFTRVCFFFLSPLNVSLAGAHLGPTNYMFIYFKLPYVCPETLQFI